MWTEFKVQPLDIDAIKVALHFCGGNGHSFYLEIRNFI